MLIGVYSSVMDEAHNFGDFIYKNPRQFYARHGGDIMLTKDGRFVVLEINRRPY